MSNPTVDLKVPSVGESVSEVEIGEWLKHEGDLVRQDESVVVLETDKATMEIPSPVNGRLASMLRKKGDRVQIGDVLGRIEPGEFAMPPANAAAGTPPPTVLGKEKGGARVMPAAARLLATEGLTADQVQPSGPGGRMLKEDVQRAVDRAGVPAPAPEPVTAPSSDAAKSGRIEEVVPMSLLRRKIAGRLVQAQHEAALLTTFNEIDMSTVMALRKEHQERFVERYKTKLGLMSFFVKAVVDALKDVPQINAEVRGETIVYRNYRDIGIAIGGGRGLVVPVLRAADQMSFAEIELAIAGFALKAKENKIRPEDLEGGTFTITNGGIYGSLLSTPLVNPPQSGVLGLHAIQDRPIAVGGQVVIRPMMYVALGYDHRIVDGREAVTFLKRVKELIESPVRMLVEI